MAVTEALKPLAPGHLEPDPNVVVPEHVKRAAAEAEALHQRMYAKDPAQQSAPAKEAIPQPQQPVPEDPAQVAADAEQARIDAEAVARAAAQDNQSQPQQSQPQPQPQPQRQPAPGPEDENDQTWKHRFLSMQGRYNAASKQIGQMEHQMSELGQELVRTQSLVHAARQTPLQEMPPAHNHNKLITDEDRQNYGDDLIDLTRRAAREVISPELEALRNENQNLKKTMNTSVKQALFADVARSIPNWRQINQTVQWRTWLTLPNLYTGQIRQQMLNAAVAGAEAPKVIQLFRDFLAEAHATGMSVPAAQAVEQQQATPAPPRTPALSLEQLAAPGKARPAAGDTQVPSEKPIYTRAQVQKFYDDSRKGLYAGREAEYRAFEADLTLAQKEGRIR